MRWIRATEPLQRDGGGCGGAGAAPAPAAPAPAGAAAAAAAGAGGGGASAAGAPPHEQATCSCTACLPLEHGVTCPCPICLGNCAASPVVCPAGVCPGGGSAVREVRFRGCGAPPPDDAVAWGPMERRFAAVLRTGPHRYSAWSRFMEELAPTYDGKAPGTSALLEYLAYAGNRGSHIARAAAEQALGAFIVHIKRERGLRRGPAWCCPFDTVLLAWGAWALGERALDRLDGFWARMGVLRVAREQVLADRRLPPIRLFDMDCAGDAQRSLESLLRRLPGPYGPAHAAGAELLADVTARRVTPRELAQTYLSHHDPADPHREGRLIRFASFERGLLAADQVDLRAVMGFTMGIPWW
jgi:hypothetical protein